ncbi:MAG: hypothetical protein ACRDGF_05210 [Chloroflexota bacterium]
MKRTTIVAPEALLEALHAIAQSKHASLAEVIREGLEWRASQSTRALTFIGSGESTTPPFDIGARSGDAPFQPLSWR